MHFPCQYLPHADPPRLARRSAGSARADCRSIALTIAWFADGFAFFVWTASSVLWLAIVALAGACAGRWLSRSTPASVLSVIAGAVGLLHVVRVAWSTL